jgi:hypothetical protein
MAHLHPHRRKDRAADLERLARQTNAVIGGPELVAPGRFR